MLRRAHPAPVKHRHARVPHTVCTTLCKRYSKTSVVCCHGACPSANAGQELCPSSLPLVGAASAVLCYAIVCNVRAERERSSTALRLCCIGGVKGSSQGTWIGR